MLFNTANSNILGPLSHVVFVHQPFFPRPFVRLYTETDARVQSSRRPVLVEEDWDLLLVFAPEITSEGPALAIIPSRQVGIAMPNLHR